VCRQAEEVSFKRTTLLSRGKEKEKMYTHGVEHRQLTTRLTWTPTAISRIALDCAPPLCDVGSAPGKDPLQWHEQQIIHILAAAR